MRWLMRLSLVLAALIALGAGGGYLYLRSSLPQISGTIIVPGATGPIQVIRDRHGVPHIYAQNPNDAYFGLGFVHAQDRLWQMEVNRRIAAGRLSELFGASTVDTDKFLRTIGIRDQAERSIGRLDSVTRAGLDAYAAGVNAFLATRRGALPPEFVFFRHEPEPWTPADSVAWVKMMAWDLSGNWSTELARLRLLRRLSPQQIAEFFAPYPGEAPIELAGLDEAHFAAARRLELDRLAAIMPAPPEGIGSNNWAVSGARSATRKPLLANDPHLGLATPAIWYFAHMSAPGLDVIGASLPGVPAIVLGRTQRVAWAFTNTGPDTQDLYLERVDAKDPSQYQTPDGWRNFEVRREIIRVKDQPPVELEVRISRHGPIISDVLKDARGLAESDIAIAFAWTALRDDDLTAQAAFRIGGAASAAELRAALIDFHSPQQNVVFADVDGNIGFFAPGRVPVRSPENNLRGLLPAPGWDARYDWQGFIPYDELPQSSNPRAGKIVTANHKIVPDNYPHFLTSEWTEPYRARRIEDLLAEREVHSIESFQRLQADVSSLMAKDFLPILLAAPVDGADSLAMRERLARWDGSMAGTRPEPLLFAAWYRELTRLVYADELGDQFDSLWRPRPIFLHNVLTDVAGQSRWCDDVATRETETCADMIDRALDRAIADLRLRYGTDPERWTWGAAHVATGNHRPFSRVPVLRDLFEIRVPTPGDTYSVNVGRHDIRNESAPFANVHSASLRAIYDLADLDRSLFIHSTGQSGNVLSPLFDSFAEPWSRVEYVAMTTRRDDILAGALGTLVLQPR